MLEGQGITDRQWSRASAGAFCGTHRGRCFADEQWVGAGGDGRRAWDEGAVFSL